MRRDKRDDDRKTAVKFALKSFKYGKWVNGETEFALGITVTSGSLREKERDTHNSRCRVNILFLTRPCR